MKQNFIESDTGQVIKYHSNRSENCQLGEVLTPGRTILKIKKQSVIKANNYEKNITRYYGCKQVESFREIRIKYENDDLSYEFFGPDNISLFRTIRKNEGDKRVSHFFLNDQVIYKVIERKREKYEEVLFKKYPFTVNLNYNGGRINFNSSQAFNSAYRLKIYPGRRIEYYDDESKLISFNKFQQNIGFRGVSYFVDLALRDLPKTKFISSGNRNTKMLEELRNAQTFLISGNNIDYVKNLINTYIKAADEGNIIDNRR